MLGKASYKKFWQNESQAPLLNNNRGFLENGKPAPSNLMSKATAWPKVLASRLGEPPARGSNLEVDPDIARVIVKDAERTFASADFRSVFIGLLRNFVGNTGNYGQGASYLASYLSLWLEGPTVEGMMLTLDSTDTKGYWQAEAVGFATDAYVFESLLQQHVPAVAKALAQRGILPETYAQKWFVGLGVHVLPFDALFDFLDYFMANGFPFLIHFGLSLCRTLEAQLLAATAPQNLYGLLRLDEKYVDVVPVARTIVDGAIAAHKKDPTLGNTDFAALRDIVYDTKLRARMESAAARRAEAAAAAAAGSDSDSEDEELECQVCREDLPDVYCPTCNKGYCNSCHEDGICVKQKHSVIEFDFDDKTHIKSSIALPESDSEASGSSSEEEEEEEEEPQRPSKTKQSAPAVGGNAGTPSSETVWLAKGPTSVSADKLALFHELGLTSRAHEGTVFVMRSFKFLVPGEAISATHLQVMELCGEERLRRGGSKPNPEDEPDSPFPPSFGGGAVAGAGGAVAATSAAGASAGAGNADAGAGGAADADDSESDDADLGLDLFG